MQPVVLAGLVLALVQTELFERPFRARDAQGDIEIEQGMASPCVGDLDRDGLPDLLVGQGDGRVRFYRNVGTRARPRFEGFAYVQAGDKDARVSTGDGKGFGPNLGDVTADGIPDLVSGSHYGLSAHVFAGRADGSFGARSNLVPLVRTGPTCNSGSRVALGDWDLDGDLDLISAELFFGPAWLFRNVALPGMRPHFAPIEELRSGGLELDAGGGNEPAPTLADWDADGFLDLIIGTGAGDVRLHRMHGTLDCGPAETLLAAPATAERARPVPDRSTGGWSLFAQRSQTSARPCVVDWNGDGRLDLLVGDDARAEGLEPVLDETSQRAKQELKSFQRDLRPRAMAVDARVRADVLERMGLDERSYHEHEATEERFWDELHRAHVADPTMRALRAAQATVEQELARLRAPTARRSTVWVYLLKSPRNR